MTQETAALADPAPGALYRALWRWHFYAGLLALPFLMLLALTGAIYLFKPELDDLLYRPMLAVEPRGAEISPDRWLESARAGLGGTVIAADISARPDRAVRLTVRLPGGTQRTAFVDPYDAALKGSIPAGGAMETVKRLHSLTLFGAGPNMLIEIVAGWTVILVVTGLFLWFPRRRGAAAFALRKGDPKRRPFWRNLHAVTGLYAAGILLFLAVTGMLWSPVWGDRVMGAVRDAGWGRPAAPPAASAWDHAGPHSPPAEGVGWTMERAVLHIHDSAPAPGSLARVMETAAREGLARPYIVSIPSDAALAWTVAFQGPDVRDARSLYIDGGSGEVLADLRHPDFGWGAKMFEWSIAVHQGTQYGWPNRIVMLLACIAAWVMAVSGVMMWWKRRPRAPLWRRLGAPPPPGRRAGSAALAVIAPLAILYPLTGATLVLFLAADLAAAHICAIRRKGATA